MPKSNKQSKAKRQTKKPAKQKLDDFIKDGLPLLLELQCLPFDTLTPKVRRRIELTFRAYSAAVYAQKNQLNSLQKESIISAFNAECFSVLEQISEIASMTKRSPAAERCALLSDYQSWVNQVADLLQEALNALNYDKWVQRLVSIPPGEALSRKDGRLQPSKTFLNMLAQRSKVFEDDRYLSKFGKLFHRQLQLEQRVGLTIEITGDWISALISYRKNKKKMTQKIEGEWSKPMNKRKMMTALKIDSYKTFNAWSKDKEMKQAGNRQTFTIRLDILDDKTRQKLEKA